MLCAEKAQICIGNLLFYVLSLKKEPKNCRKAEIPGSHALAKTDAPHFYFVKRAPFFHARPRYALTRNFSSAASGAACRRQIDLLTDKIMPEQDEPVYLRFALRNLHAATGGEEPTCRHKSCA